MWTPVHLSSSLQAGGKQQFARHVAQQSTICCPQPSRHSTSRQRNIGRVRATTSDDAANSSSDLLFPIQDYFHLGSGDTIPMPMKRPDAGPLAEYDREEAISVQLKVSCGCTQAASPLKTPPVRHVIYVLCPTPLHCHGSHTLSVLAGAAVQRPAAL